MRPANSAAILDELPVDASALEAKLSRQAELRTLTRKYAADVDGVLQWAQESRQRLAQLDVSEEGLTALAARVDELARELAQAAVDLSGIRRKAAKRLAKEVTAELSGLAMADAEFTIDVSNDVAADKDDPAALSAALRASWPGPVPMASIRSSSVSRRTAAWTSCRWPRAPPAASCPG